MDPIVPLLVENLLKLQPEAVEALWKTLDADQRKQAQEILNTTPVFQIQEGQVVGDMKKDPEASRKALRTASRTRLEKHRTVRKASRILGKVDRLSKNPTPEKAPEEEEGFKEWITIEAQDDSRGPNQILLLTKSGGKDAREQIEKLADELYSELGLPAWVQEGPEKGTADRDYSLFSSLWAYGPELVEALNKKLEEFAKKNS